MAKILVTGGLGFIGSNLVPELKKRGHEVWVCDLHQSRKLEEGYINFFILHTRQHYSCNMDNVFFKQLQLPQSEYNLEVSSSFHADENLILIDPVDFLDFLQLGSNAMPILTDSSDIQEKSCILKVLCVKLKGDIERYENLEIGSNILAGVLSERIVRSIKNMFEKENSWGNPFGNEKSVKVGILQ